MTEEDLKRNFARNLNRYMYMRDKKAPDLVRDLGYSQSIISDWINGKKLPRAARLQRIADYLGVKVSDLMSVDERHVPDSYYMNDDAREMAEFIFRNPEYKVLFDASRRVKPEDIEFVKQMIDRMTKDD